MSLRISKQQQELHQEYNFFWYYRYCQLTKWKHLVSFFICLNTEIRELKIGSFSCFCLVIMRNFVYLQAEKGDATICTPDYLNVNKLKIYRNVLNLNHLRFALRKIYIPKGCPCKWLITKHRGSPL